MHYSRHSLTASVACVTTRTYASANNHWARLLVTWSKTVSSVQLRRFVRAFRLGLHVGCDIQRVQKTLPTALPE